MPKAWLGGQITVPEVEADLVDRGTAEYWLADWRALVAGMEPRDELRCYCSPLESWDILAGRAGYAVVRDGVVIDAILTVMN